jgi:hypothetical protein
LGSDWVHFTTLESLIDKLGALALAAPGILIKLRRCYAALAGVPRSPSAVLQVAGPLRDELRELASMPFWRTAVAPWIRPVHLTIIVPGGIGRGQYEPSTALVSYSFPGLAPGAFRVSVPTLSVGARAEAAHKELVGEAILLVTREAIEPDRSGELLRNTGLTCKLEAGHSIWVGSLDGTRGNCSGRCALRVCLWGALGTESLRPTWGF